VEKEQYEDATDRRIKKTSVLIWRGGRQRLKTNPKNANVFPKNIHLGGERTKNMQNQKREKKTHRGRRRGDGRGHKGISITDGLFRTKDKDWVKKGPFTCFFCFRYDLGGRNKSRKTE